MHTETHNKAGITAFFSDCERIIIPARLRFAILNPETKASDGNTLLPPDTTMPENDRKRPRIISKSRNSRFCGLGTGSRGYGQTRPFSALYRHRIRSLADPPRRSMT